ncbi:Uncharacterized protein HSBGL_2862 [Halapricum desulfuricans]|uniref:DUF7998 domain-containing protein n=1 Tax=Halapricum desulfuricans TaxID=2841257 RepID=A0A897NST4_9EURY|nr:hypothetical protein [Halapricum desulfuricans]QSG13256.1 Uncharacterized protein HSBGL_2862 [Halapricum desulfuricans]
MGLFSRGDSGGPEFDEYGEFVPSNVPDPGPRLTDHAVLEGEEHVEIHRTVRDIFEERGVYDTTFGYNLAKLNLDPRHPDAGFRYAVEDDEVLHVEFTPTTAFCPQGEVLTTAASRALNDLADRHGFEAVEVRIADRHQHSDAINEQLQADADGELADSSGDEQADLPF